ncbi:SusC/RagA family TonB-linked outer membrane protein [Flavobacterium sp. RSP15]|uniref:SusC/RagA family TonB-linked outer membrane protein n=1 Tax=Flavobacterium sp. RSP15 TaxID=2497485 RepID=UPI000F83AAE7|nr:TonB-dependent receptor [Flavobacterium sp. RSP15]RTY86539.1 TonB-dependent receptor [Flavobacterium sp. RSP15]
MKLKFIFFLVLLSVLITQSSFAQKKTVNGKVSDETGLSIPGANVLISGTTTGIQTDFEGNFSISSISVGDNIVISFIGYKSQTIKITQSNTYNVALQPDAQMMDEVVVIGYGVQKKRDLTSSIASIKGDDIQGLVTPSFESQLAGRASGVQITSATGIIGEAPKVRIRGTASISSGTNPLYIVDGMPVYSGSNGGFASSNALGDINPADIESFEVLKDGAATAIYGSRAANGVIIITTKKGKKGSMKVSYNVVTGFASAVKTFDLLETEDFLTISNEKRSNRTPVQPAWAVGNEFNTDWQGAVLRKGAFQMDHNLSVSGGSDKTRYYMSMGYTEQEGVAQSNEMTRYTFRTNIEHDVNNWLTIGGNVALTRTEYNGLNTGGNSLSGNIFNAIRQAPNTPIFDATNPTGYNLNLTTGTVGQGTNLSPIGDNISNIAYVLAKNRFQSKINRTLINTFASAKITKDINYRFQASVDNPITGGFLYYNPTHGDGRGSNGRLQNDNTDLLRWNIQNSLSYNKTFAENHNVSATAVAEYQKEKNQYFVGIGTDLLNEFYNQNLVTGAYGVQQSGGSVTEIGIMSYIGRLSYNYKQRYFVQASIRRDGISKLSADSRWNNFSGYSAGWNIANEEFMKPLSNIVNEFKLRASYSEVGNTEIGTYPYLGLTSASQYGALNGIAFTQFGNDLLQWETSKKTDFGVDLALFQNKVKLTFDYFNNDIDGIVLQVPTAPSLGVPNNRISQNIGQLYNRGYEFSTDINLINSEDLRWDVGANITFQTNKVTSLPGGLDIVGGSSTDPLIAANVIIREGESVNSLFGFQYWGSNPANGNPVYYKADGSLVQGNVEAGTYSTFDVNNPSDISTRAAALGQSDKKILGNTLPTYFGGLNSKISYKDFDFSFLFRFSGGNKMFNATRRDLMNQNLNNNSTEILGRWQSAENPGDGWTPRLYASQNTFLNQASNATTRFVEDGSFISLDNVSLGYKLPKVLTDKINVDVIRFFVQAQNLLIITKYKGLNPEMETLGVDLNGTPRSKVVSLGINVNL